MASDSVKSLKAAKKARVQCFPRSDALDARVYLSHYIHIDKLRHIEITCTTGANDIERAEIRLKSASAGLRLRTADVSVESEDGAIEDKSKPGVISIGALPAESSITLKIPYDMETILQDLAVKTEIDYHTANGEFHYFSAFTIPVELPLDVNVHDHFKQKSLFSKFNIKTANQVPLELLDVELEGSEEFAVYAPRKPTQPQHVFPKQPVAVTYKIVKKPSNGDNSGTSKTGNLALAVEYRCLNEDVLDRLRAHFAAAVKDSPVTRVSRLLLAAFVLRLEQTVLPPQYEKIALLDKVDLGAWDDADWADSLDSLPQPVRDETRAWLQTWLKVRPSLPSLHFLQRTELTQTPQENKTVHLPKTTSTTTSPPPPPAPLTPHPPRRMTITVSIPQTHILHTASLTLTPNPNNPNSNPPTIATLGHPLPATLSITHTRHWSTPTSLTHAANLSSAADPIDFIVTLDAPPDTWLIGGQRRAAFQAREGEERVFGVVLVPWRGGVVGGPGVDVRARVRPRESGEKEGKSGGGSGGVTGGEEEVLSCETDFLNYGEVVTVVPDLRRGTLGVGEMGGAGGQRERGAGEVVWLEGVGV